MEKLRGSDKPGHCLQANFVMKEPDSWASTKARLVLDPSGTQNQTLVSPLNIEPTISAVLRRIQALPVLFSIDIGEAFFKLLLHQDSINFLLFLIDSYVQTKLLTAEPGPTTWLITVRPLVSVVGSYRAR